ncbi:MAG: outer membrane beta-barrel protein [Candidatus Dactylopiibacterium sp.]|nr:outer membrane beta-barrel protein [Candidatus Dactylopiibacterium sp.]
MQNKTLAACLAASCAVPALAQTGASLQIGTTGYGFDVGQQLTERFGARIGYSALNYSHAFDTSDVDYDGKIKLSNLRALADYDLGHGFRVSGGLVFGNNRVDVHGKPSGGTYTFNGTAYPTTHVNSVDGRVDLGRKVAPYVGIGYGMPGRKGWGFHADLGAMYVGKSRSTLDVRCGAALTPAQCTRLRNDAETERQKMQDKADAYTWYPVLNLGVSYGF